MRADNNFGDGGKTAKGLFNVVELKYIVYTSFVYCLDALQPIALKTIYPLTLCIRETPN